MINNSIGMKGLCMKINIHPYQGSILTIEIWKRFLIDRAGYISFIDSKMILIYHSQKGRAN